MDVPSAAPSPSVPLAAPPAPPSHAPLFRKIIENLRKSPETGRTRLQDNPFTIVDDFHSNVFSNEIKNRIPASYLKAHRCEGADGCPNPPTQRCHGHGEERPELLFRALQRLGVCETKGATLNEIKIAYWEEHIPTKFRLLCSLRKNLLQIPESTPN